MASSRQRNAAHQGAPGAPEARRPRPWGTGHSVATSKLGVLLDDPAARAVLDRHFQNLSDNPRFTGARNMTLRTLRIFAPEIFTDSALSAADAELNALSPQ